MAKLSGFWMKTALDGAVTLECTGEVCAWHALLPVGTTERVASMDPTSFQRRCDEGTALEVVKALPARANGHHEI